MEWVITLLVAGAVLLLLETVLPGMIAGIIGLLCLITGVVIAFSVFGPQQGSYMLAGVFIALVVGTLLWLKFFPDSRVKRVGLERVGSTTVKGS